MNQTGIRRPPEKTFTSYLNIWLLFLCILVMFIIFISYEISAGRNALESLTIGKSVECALKNLPNRGSFRTWNNIPEKNSANSNSTRVKPEKCSTVIDYRESNVSISMDEYSTAYLEKKLNYLRAGGHYIPSNCTSNHRVAIVIPYRDRASHLRILLNNMHPFLTNQQLDYSIIVVEQVANQTFNRGKLLNVGFLEAMKFYDWQCFVFHDVDLLPEDRRNLHTCPEANPRHMAVAVDKFNYRLFYEGMFGTSCSLTVEQYLKVNGFSNRFWGWGGEDDDMYSRIISAGYKVDRYNTSIARYKMIKHERDRSNPVNPCRYKLLANTKRDWKIDGLNSVHYKVLSVTFEPLYTHILVDLLESKEKPLVDKQFC